MSQPVNWRTALQEWLKNNPKTIPENLAELHQAFLHRFPKDKIGDMTLEQYALGHDDYKNSFCYWLEWETAMLGSVRGGSSAKWGAWWSSQEGDWKFNRGFSSAQAGLNHLKEGLLAYLRTLPEFDGFDTLQMMRFLYTYKFQHEAVIFQNQQVLQTAVQGFVRFANSPLYGREEYDYKKDLLQALKQTLTIVLEEDAEQGREALQTWRKAYRESINNLTSWQTTDNLSKLLQNVPAMQIQQHLMALLDEDGDLGERIDAFREAVETDFQTYLQAKSTLPLGLISMLLMGSDPDTHIIYRASIIDKACADWGASRVTSGTRNDGTKYSQYMSLIPPLQSQLTKALDRAVDLIDVHSLLWFNYTDGYDQFKQIPDKTTAAVEERPFMRHLIQVANRTRNIILYGPPGTGKTYWAREFGLRFDPQHVRFITFHQSFAYEDFVEGLKPYAEDGNVLYDVVPGVFRSLCRKAAKDPEHDYLLVIDEINRANIAKVFGELITLLEDDKRRGRDNELFIELPYSQETFSIPANLYVFGTMNTADRSIALLDIALRRRFTFIEVPPNPGILMNNKVDDLSLGELLRELNGRIAILLDCDHQIGHSYFWGIDNLAELRFAWEHRIVPLLQEYFYNDGERLQAVLGEQFVVASRPDPAKQQALANWIDPETTSYQVIKLSDEAFMRALKQLANPEEES